MAIFLSLLRMITFIIHVWIMSTLLHFELREWAIHWCLSPNRISIFRLLLHFFSIPLLGKIRISACLLLSCWSGGDHHWSFMRQETTCSRSIHLMLLFQCALCLEAVKYALYSLTFLFIIIIFLYGVFFASMFNQLL